MGEVHKNIDAYAVEYAIYLRKKVQYYPDPVINILFILEFRQKVSINPIN